MKMEMRPAGRSVPHRLCAFALQAYAGGARNMLPQPEIYECVPDKKKHPRRDEHVTKSNHVVSPPGSILPKGGEGYSWLAAMTIQDRITKAFSPIRDLCQAAAYPVCLLLVMAGMFCVMLGRKKQGIDMIKWAAIGYIGVQFTPTIMALIAEIAKAMVQ